MPFLSIVIANYNYGHFLESAIKSVLSQGMGREIELIICDAMSTDNSIEIIKKYANGLPAGVHRSQWESVDGQEVDSTKIVWWCSEKDGGQSDAFNKGFSHSSGRFLTWLNADDILLPGAIFALKKVAERYPRESWFGGGAVYFNGESGFEFKKSVLPTTLAQRLFKVPSWCRVDAPSTFFSKSLFDRSQKLNVSLAYVMDIDLWMQFCEMGVKLRYIDRYVWGFRLHSESKTSSAMVKNIRKSRFERERIEIRVRRNISNRNEMLAIIRKRMACILDCSYIRRLFSSQKYRMDIKK